MLDRSNPPVEPNLPDTRRLQHFVAAMEAPTLAAAAANLSITQQALSASIRQLEKDLAVDLFSRSQRTLNVTPAGKELYSAAKPLLAGARQLVETTQNAARGDLKPFVIGHSPAISSEEVYRLVDPLIRDDTTLAVTAQPLYPSQIRDALLDGTIDIALRRGVESPTDLATTIVSYHELRLALDSSHPLAARTSVTVGELAPYPVIVWAPEHHSFYTDFLVSHCRRVGFEPKLVVNRVQGTPPFTAVLTHPQACAFVTDEPGHRYGGNVTIISFLDPPLAPVQMLWIPHTASVAREKLIELNNPTQPPAPRSAVLGLQPPASPTE